MIFTFRDAIEELGEDFAFRIANELRPDSRYIFSDILPAQNRMSYSVESGALTVRPTMAGMSGMDSPYPPSGSVDISTFLERSAKISNEVTFPEETLRELQRLVRQAEVNGGSGKEQVVENLLNFTEKVLVQAHIDTFEWLRGQALCFGEINWTFNGKQLVVDYGIPNDHIFNTRTTSSNEAYGSSNSKFWEDHRAAIQKLGYNYNGPYMHPNTYDEIVTNSANNIQVTEQSGNTFTLRRYQEDGSGNRTEQLSGDRRDQVEVTVYGVEGELIDPANPDQTLTRPFLPEGRLVYTGQGQPNEFRVGDGSTQDVESELALGYTHIAPTVEGDGQPGRWARVFTPEQKPWQLTGQGVTNGLPVIENPEKLVVTSTEMT